MENQLIVYATTAFYNKCPKFTFLIPKTWIIILLIIPEEKENIFEFPNLKGMHFIHVNARSILPKMSELRIMAKESKAAVVAISET